MDLRAKKTAESDHLAAHSLKLREESQALIKKLRELFEEGRELRQHSTSIRQSLKAFIDRPPNP